MDAGGVWEETGAGVMEEEGMEGKEMLQGGEEGGIRERREVGR